MALLKKYNTYVGLKDIDILIEDKDINSSYFRIFDIPNVFSAGKTAFRINGSELLRIDREVKIELLNKDGNVIYTEYPDYLEGTSRLVSVFIYPDELYGEALLTIVGEAITDLDGNPIPSEWKDVYNVRWQKKILIDPNLKNDDVIRFYSTPIITTEEKYTPYLIRTFTSSSNPEFLDYNTGTVNGRLVGGEYQATIRDGSFIRQMEGGVLTVSSPKKYDSTSWNQAYVSEIKKVVNQNTIILKHPYQVTSSLPAPYISKKANEGFEQIFDVPNSSEYYNFVNSSYNIRYEVEPTYSVTENYRSFAKISIYDMETFSGDIYSTKVFVRSVGSDRGFELMGDKILESRDQLLDNTSANTDEKIGYFYNQNTINNFWTSSVFSPDNSMGVPTLKRDSSLILDSMHTFHDEILHLKCDTTESIDGHVSIRDYSGYDNHATLTGSFVQVSGQVDNALSSSAITDTVNLYKIQDDIDSGDDWSISFWVYLSTSVFDTFFVALQFYDTDGTSYTIYPAYSSGDDLRITRVTTEPITTNYDHTHNEGITDSNWHHIVLVKKSNSNLEYYIDNTKYTHSSGVSLNLGDGSRIIFQPAITIVDEYRIFNRVLTTKEVDNLYNFYELPAYGLDSYYYIYPNQQQTYYNGTEYKFSTKLYGKTNKKRIRSSNVGNTLVTANKGRLFIFMSGSAFNDSPGLENKFHNRGKLIKEIEMGGNTSEKNFETLEFGFLPDQTGYGRPLFLIDSGEWYFSDVKVESYFETGFSPGSTTFIIPINDWQRKDKYNFKAEFYNYKGVRADVIATSSEAFYTGSNIYIEGTDNILTGSLYISNVLSKGIELAGQNSAYIRNVGYTGWQNANAGNGSGFMIWSGSVLPTVAPGFYNGVGLELHGGSGSAINPTTGVGETHAMRYNTTTGRLEITGSIYATDGYFSGSLEANQIRVPTGGPYKAEILSNGYARFTSASIGGWNVDETSLYNDSASLTTLDGGQILIGNTVGDQSTYLKSFSTYDQSILSGFILSTTNISLLTLYANDINAPNIGRDAECVKIYSTSYESSIGLVYYTIDGLIEGYKAYYEQFGDKYNVGYKLSNLVDSNKHYLEISPMVSGSYSGDFPNWEGIYVSGAKVTDTVDARRFTGVTGSFTSASIDTGSIGLLDVDSGSFESVGIGTSTPNHILDIYQQGAHVLVDGQAGGSNVSGSIEIKGITDNANGGYGDIIFNGYDDNVATENIISRIKSVRPSNSDSSLWFSTTNNSIENTRLVIDENGYVGIGTTNPSYELHVVGTVTSSLFMSPSASVDVLYVDDKIGIGTEEPNEVLHICSQGAKILIDGEAGGSGVSGSIEIKGSATNDNTGYGEIIFNGHDENVATENIISRIKSVRSSNSDSSLWFSVTNNSSEFTLLSLDHAGYVGINTISPSYELEVVGDVSASSYIGTSGSFDKLLTTDSVGIGTTDPEEMIHIYSQGAKILIDGEAGGSDVSGSIKIKGIATNDNTGYGEIIFSGYDDNVAVGDIISRIKSVRSSNQNSSLWFSVTNNSSEFTILSLDHAGHVGINTTNPSYELEVDGDASASVFIGSRSYLSYGYNATWTEQATNTTHSAFTVNGSSNGQGYRMIRNGVVTGLSIQFDCIDNSGTGFLRSSIQINGVTTDMTLTDNLSGTGDRGQITTANPQSFSSGDTINVELILDESSGADIIQVDDIACLVEIKT